MKRWIIAVAALLTTALAVAQEPSALLHKRPGQPPKEQGFVLPDSLAHMSPWKPDFKTMEPVQTRPVVSMSSVVEASVKQLPARIEVINNNTLRLGRHFNISNGQAWNWGPFPNSFLDARTISMPMPR